MPEPSPSPLSVLFLGHGAERTGPPIYLLRVLAGLRAVPWVMPSVLLLEGGPLLADFRRLAPTAVVAQAPDLGDLPPADVVVVNTAGSIGALDALPWVPRRLVSHVHELAVGFELHLDPRLRRRVLDQSDELWVVSDAVADYLVRCHAVERDRVRLHRGVLAVGAFDPPNPADRAAARAELGVPDEVVLVGASGTLDWRKGPDLFLEVARQARLAAKADLQFVWIGGGGTGPWVEAMVRARASVGLDGAVLLVSETDRAQRLFGALDLFLLPSREDAYPLVCLEAAALGVPIVAFAAGGAPELIDAGAGIVVPYPDVAALSRAVAALADDDVRRASLGAAARLAALPHRVERAIPGLVADLARVAGR